MIDTLIAFGCSNTYGTEALVKNDDGIKDKSINNQYAYPKYLADRIGCSYKNLASPGISNIEIASKVMEAVQSPEFSAYADPFIIIGWTEDERIPVISKKNKHFTIGTGDLSYLLEKDHTLKVPYIFSKKEFDEQFVLNIMEHIYASPFYNKMNFFIKYAVINYLQQNNIKFFTFPTLSYPFDPLYNLLSSPNNILCHDSIGNPVFDMLEKFLHFCPNYKGYHLHYTSHKALADYLFFELAKRRVIKLEDVHTPSSHLLC